MGIFGLARGGGIYYHGCRAFSCSRKLHEKLVSGVQRCGGSVVDVPMRYHAQ